MICDARHAEVPAASFSQQTPPLETERSAPREEPELLAEDLRAGFRPFPGEATAGAD